MSDQIFPQEVLKAGQAIRVSFPVVGGRAFIETTIIARVTHSAKNSVFDFHLPNEVECIKSLTFYLGDITWEAIVFGKPMVVEVRAIK